MFKFLLLLSLSSNAVASYFEYQGQGQFFDEQGPSQSYNVGLNIMPGIYGNRYYFAQIDSQGAATVSHCFVVRPFPLHRQSRDRVVVLAPPNITQNSCNDTDSYQPVGWGYSWLDDGKSLLLTINGKKKGEYTTLNIREWYQRSDSIRFFVEVVGFNVVTESHGELSLGRYWQEKYEIK